MISYGIVGIALAPNIVSVVHWFEEDKNRMKKDKIKTFSLDLRLRKRTGKCRTSIYKYIQIYKYTAKTHICIFIHI